MPVIYIKNLIIQAKHGVHQRERTNAQSFKISVELTVNSSKAGISDNLDDTVNWSQVRDIIVNTVQNNSFNLVERLAREVADQILLDKRISKAVVTIDKPEAFQTGIPGVRLEINN